MAFQNNYNNYIGSQKRNSTGMFKEKVKNSLGGVSVGNNTTANKTNSVNTVVTPNVLGKSTTPNVTKTSTGVPTTNLTTPITSTAPSTGVSNTAPNPVQVGAKMTPANNTVPTPTVTPSTVEGASGGLGMMSLSDVNNALGVDNFTSGARSVEKSPQQMAQELVETQKAQLQKDWEQKKAELELQRNQLNESYQQSITDANNAYQETDEQLKLNRYQQQEDLAIDATRRGIQYSPQQLALENVANINLNKNLADASKKRNELLNQLQIQINQSLENINLGLQNAVNTYNSSVTDLMSDYQKQMMDWAYNDEQTQQDREWQEKMNKDSQAFEKEMAELQNKWQAEQNALDRKTYGSRSGGSGGYRSYGGRGYYSSYRPYTGYSWGSGYSTSGSGNSGTRNLDMNSPEIQEATLNTLKNLSTDVFNSANNYGARDLDEATGFYSSYMKPAIEGLRNIPNSEKVHDEMVKTYETALTHLYNESYGRSSGLPYKVGDTWVQPSVVRKPQGDTRTAIQKQTDRKKYFDKYGVSNYDGSSRDAIRANPLFNVEDMFDGNMFSPYLGGNLLKNNTKKTSTTKKSTTKKTTTTKKQTKSQKEMQKAINNAFKVPRSIMDNSTKKSTTKKTTTNKKPSVGTSVMKKATTNKNYTINTSKKSTTKKSTTKKKESFWDKLNKFISKSTRKV